MVSVRHPYQTYRRIQRVRMGLSSRMRMGVSSGPEEDVVERTSEVRGDMREEVWRLCPLGPELRW